MSTEWEFVHQPFKLVNTREPRTQGLNLEAFVNHRTGIFRCGRPESGQTPGNKICSSEWIAHPTQRRIHFSLQNTLKRFNPSIVRRDDGVIDLENASIVKPLGIRYTQNPIIRRQVKIKPMVQNPKLSRSRATIPNPGSSRVTL